MNDAQTQQTARFSLDRFGQSSRNRPPEADTTVEQRREDSLENGWFSRRLKRQLFDAIAARLTPQGLRGELSAKQKTISSYYQDVRSLGEMRKELERMVELAIQTNLRGEFKRSGDSIIRDWFEARKLIRKELGTKCESLRLGIRKEQEPPANELLLAEIANEAELFAAIAHDIDERIWALIEYCARLMEQGVKAGVFGLVKQSDEGLAPGAAAEYSFIEHHVTVSRGEDRGRYVMALGVQWTKHTHLHRIVDAVYSSLDRPAVKVPARVRKLRSCVPDFLRGSADLTSFLSGDLVSGTVIQEEQAARVELIEVAPPPRPPRSEFAIRSVLGDPALVFARKVVLTGWV